MCFLRPRDAAPVASKRGRGKRRFSSEAVTPIRTKVQEICSRGFAARLNRDSCPWDTDVLAGIRLERPYPLRRLHPV